MFLVHLGRSEQVPANNNGEHDIVNDKVNVMPLSTTGASMRPSA